MLNALKIRLLHIIYCFNKQSTERARYMWTLIMVTWMVCALVIDMFVNLMIIPFIMLTGNDRVDALYLSIDKGRG